MAAGQSKGLCACAPDGEDDPSTGGLDKLGLLGTNGRVSRRDVLGAAVAVPLLSLPLDGGGQVGVAVGPGAASPAHHSASESTPTLPSPIKGEEAWSNALAFYRAAEAAVEEAGRLCSAASRADIHAAEDAFGDRLEELYDSLRGLLVVSAPDVAALCVKAELAFEHEIGTLAGCEAGIAAMRADARRLGGS